MDIPSLEIDTNACVTASVLSGPHSFTLKYWSSEFMPLCHTNLRHKLIVSVENMYAIFEGQSVNGASQIV